MTKFGLDGKQVGAAVADNGDPRPSRHLSVDIQ